MKNYDYSLLLVPLAVGIALAAAAAAKSQSSPWKKPFEKKPESLDALFGRQDYASRLASSLPDKDRDKVNHFLMRMGGIAMFMIMRHLVMKKLAAKEGRMESALRFYGKRADQMLSKLEKSYLS